jgi:D-sedoheptulose 7-phosphate isomerase
LLPGFEAKSYTRTKATIITSYLKEGADLRLSTTALANQIEKAADAIAESFRNGCKMMVFGNGGSAADAQHIAAELSGRFQKDRNPLPALALTVNPSSVTAIANDYSFDEIFARQIQALAKEGDVVLGISTSGKSRNVLKGLETARELSVYSIGMCGLKGDMAKHSDILLAVPGQTTSLLQEIHIAIGHLLCLLVEEEMFG